MQSRKAKKQALQAIFHDVSKQRFHQETRHVFHEFLPNYDVDEFYHDLCGGLPFEPEMTVLSMKAGNELAVTLRYSDQIDFYVYFTFNIVGSCVCELKNIQCYPNGKGYGALFLKSFINTMEKLNMEEIRINEAEDVGRFFWPKIGFVIHEKSWTDRYQNHLIQHLITLSKNYPDVGAYLEEFFTLIKEKESYALCDLANRKKPEIKGIPFGLFLLSGNLNIDAFEWRDAVFYLKDYTQMSFFNDYLNRKNLSLEGKTIETRIVCGDKSLRPNVG